MNLVEIIADWNEPGSNEGPGRHYSPRLLLSLISGLSFDSRYIAARRPGDTAEWNMWSSKTFQSQLLAGVYNWDQIHVIGALNWGNDKPEFQPMNDPSHAEAEAEPLSLSDIYSKLSASGGNR